jgi:hypothetical protein
MEPGPGSYWQHGTVGVISEFNRYETNPREEFLKKAASASGLL